jgi:hypothetical protein
MQNLSVRHKQEMKVYWSFYLFIYFLMIFVMYVSWFVVKLKQIFDVNINMQFSVQILYNPHDISL